MNEWDILLSITTIQPGHSVGAFLAQFGVSIEGLSTSSLLSDKAQDNIAKCYLYWMYSPLRSNNNWTVEACVDVFILVYKAHSSTTLCYNKYWTSLIAIAWSNIDTHIQILKKKTT